MFGVLSAYHVGGARGRRPGQVTTVGRQKIPSIGEEEPTLISSSVPAWAGQAEEIRDELALVLDEDAQTMVVKLWRVFIHAAKAARRLCVKNIFAGVFSYARRSFGRSRGGGDSGAAGWRRRHRARLMARA